MGLPIDNRRALVEELRRRIDAKYRAQAKSGMYGEPISFGSPTRNNPVAQATPRRPDRIADYAQRKIQGPDERKVGPRHYRLI